MGIKERYRRMKAQAGLMGPVHTMTKQLMGCRQCLPIIQGYIKRQGEGKNQWHPTPEKINALNEELEPLLCAECKAAIATVTQKTAETFGIEVKENG